MRSAAPPELLSQHLRRLLQLIAHVLQPLHVMPLAATEAGLSTHLRRQATAVAVRKCGPAQFTWWQPSAVSLVIVNYDGDPAG